MELGNTIQLTKEETAELYAIRTPTPTELVILATEADVAVEIEHACCGIPRVVLKQDNHTTWDPRYNFDQNQILLAAVIAKGDCRLFYDQEIHEFFIYQYTDGDNDGPPLAHQYGLSDTVFEAALNLWCGEETDESNDNG